jgi:hypothetical protein
MQNAINALNSLDMPLPPRIADEHAVPQASEAQTESEQSATNGQAAPRPPLGATEASDERSVEHDDEFDWDPDATTPAEQAGGASTVPTPSPLPPLGARFGALKLDFDLDLPSAPDAELPALTPEELARIARNKLDLALEYVELGDLSARARCCRRWSTQTTPPRATMRAHCSRNWRPTRDADRARGSVRRCRVLRLAGAAARQDRAGCARARARRIRVRAVAHDGRGTDRHGRARARSGRPFRHGARPRGILVGARHQRVPAADRVRAVGEGDARHVPRALSAFERTYYYALYVHPVRSPMLAGRAGWIHTPLDDDAMRRRRAPDRRARLLVVPFVGMPGRRRRSNTCIRSTCDVRGTSSISASAPTRSCTTWCAT